MAGLHQSLPDVLVLPGAVRGGGLNGLIKSGDEANTFYHDAHNLDGCCDYVMANPPFNVDKVNSESAQSAGRLPFGLPSVNKAKEVGNANYLWISYFYSYLNERGRAGFVMAASATDPLVQRAVHHGVVVPGVDEQHLVP
mgnify:CR=1 FL=1